ncbi:hypothetical protein K438DRAFT_980484 [Mycena galopus ATCC 62051]|nr:hypothetical protein K438DRAFT_980484 [Mycena galopus ATCC 62051]
MFAGCRGCDLDCCSNSWWRSILAYWAIPSFSVHSCLWEPPIRLSVCLSVCPAPAHRTAPLPRPILRPASSDRLILRPASSDRPAFGPIPQPAPSPGMSSPVPPDSVPLRSPSSGRSHWHVLCDQARDHCRSLWTHATGYYL